MFWNVSARGKIRMAERFAKHPAKFLFPMLLNGSIFTTLLFKWNAQFRHEDGKLMWDHVPKDIRDNNFVLFPPDWMLDQFGIPHNSPEGVRFHILARKGDEFQFVCNPIEAGLARSMGSKLAYNSWQRALDAATAILPTADLELKTTDFSSWQRALAAGGVKVLAAMNPALRVPAEQLANENFYTGVPIDSPADPSAPAWRFNERTAPTAVAIGQTLGASPRESSTPFVDSAAASRTCTFQLPTSLHAGSLPAHPTQTCAGLPSQSSRARSSPSQPRQP